MRCDGCGKECKTLYGAEGFWLCSSCRGIEDITETIRLRDRKTELIARIKERLDGSDLTTLDAIVNLLNAERICLWLDAGELMISGDLGDRNNNDEGSPMKEKEAEK